MALGAGHTFVIFLDGGFPVNCLNAVKAVPEVCRVRCMYANSISNGTPAYCRQQTAAGCSSARAVLCCGATSWPTVQHTHSSAASRSEQGGHPCGALKASCNSHAASTRTQARTDRHTHTQQQSMKNTWQVGAC